MNPLLNTALPTDGLSRRQVLRTGGLVITLGALAAACGSNRSGSTAPGRLGVAPPQATLPEATVDDVVLLRTAQSLEYTALEVYKAAAATGGLNAAETALAEAIVADHTAHAAAVGALITGLGGEEFQCANPFLMDRAVNPIVAALDGTDDLHRDLLNIAQAVESFAGASYQALVPSVTDKQARTELMRIGGEEQRHATVLARAINPDEIFSPTFFGKPVEKDAEGFIVAYAIPSVFGKVTGIDLVVGKKNDEGARFSTQLQTPAANTLVYGYQTC